MLEYLRSCNIKEEIHTSGVKWSGSAADYPMYELYIQHTRVSLSSSMNKSKCFHQFHVALPLAVLIVFHCWMHTPLAQRAPWTVSLLVLVGSCCKKKKKNHQKLGNQCIGLWISQQHKAVKKGELCLYHREDGAHICVLVLILHPKYFCFLLCQHLGTCCLSLRVSLDALDSPHSLRQHRSCFPGCCYAF